MFILLLVFIHSLTLEAKVLTIMSYNVENLFDAKHDIIGHVDKNDWTFLPLDYPGKKEACLREKNKRHQRECLSLNWTDEKVAIRLSQIRRVVIRDQTPPDFLGLIEVENDNVVGLLAKKLGYKNYEITKSPDERGMNVALLYKNISYIKKVARKEHIVLVDRPTRNILEVEFLIAEKYPLTIFVNHWPSLANPNSWRIKAADLLNNRTKEIIKNKPHMNIIALGDFNTIDDGVPHPFKDILCKDNTYKDIIQSNKVQGTYYYARKDKWYYLDHFFTNKNLTDSKGLEVILKSYEIYSPAFINHEMRRRSYENGKRNMKMITIPRRFNLRGTTEGNMGNSDHYPILLKLFYP